MFRLLAVNVYLLRVTKIQQTISIFKYILQKHYENTIGYTHSNILFYKQQAKSVDSRYDVMIDFVMQT